MDIRKAVWQWPRMVASILVLTFHVCYGNDTSSIETINGVSIRIDTSETSINPHNRETNEEVQNEFNQFMSNMLEDLQTGIRKLGSNENTMEDSYNSGQLELVSRKLGQDGDHRVLWRRRGMTSTDEQILLLVEHFMTNMEEMVKKAGTIVTAIKHRMNGNSKIWSICGRYVTREHDHSVDLIRTSHEGVKKEEDKVGVAIGLYRSRHKLQLSAINLRSHDIIVTKGKKEAVSPTMKTGKRKRTLKEGEESDVQDDTIEDDEPGPSKTIKFMQVEKKGALPLQMRGLLEKVQGENFLSVPSCMIWKNTSPGLILQDFGPFHFSVYIPNYAQACLRVKGELDLPVSSGGSKESSKQGLHKEYVKLMGPLKSLLLDNILTMFYAALQCNREDKEAWKKPPIHIQFDTLDVILDYPDWYISDESSMP